MRTPTVEAARPTTETRPLARTPTVAVRLIPLDKVQQLPTSTVPPPRTPRALEPRMRQTPMAEARRTPPGREPVPPMAMVALRITRKDPVRRRLRTPTVGAQLITREWAPLGQLLRGRRRMPVTTTMEELMARPIIHR